MITIDDLLEDFRAGRISREELKESLRREAVGDIGLARIDHGRTARTGCPEVVYCREKTPEQVAAIFTAMAERSPRVLGTKALPAHHQAVAREIKVFYDPVSGLLTHTDRKIEARGKVVVVSAGTSDLPVAEEAAGTLEFLGSTVVRHFDCGVAGVHRILSVAGEMEEAGAVVAVAGMDGALPSVVAGITETPVIAVPTSVGYGASFKGVAALLTMLNSCAPGVAVVNIDNGFGAGQMAHVINMRQVRAGKGDG